VKNTDNAVTVFMTTRGTAVVGKFFARTPQARSAFEAEKTSAELFRDKAWRMPVLQWYPRCRGFTVLRLPDSDRLDVRARSMSRDDKVAAGAWAIDVLVEIYLSGHFHGDLQPHNVWYLDGRLVATDFEGFGRRSDEVPFLDSGDITGTDPGTPRHLDAAFAVDDEWSFHNALGVSLDDALAAARSRLGRSSPGASEKLDVLDGRRT
jgi:hypothetical protein